MPWIQIKINSTGEHAESLSDALMESGAVSVTFQDTHDNPVYEPLPGETRLWPVRRGNGDGGCGRRAKPASAAGIRLPP